MQILILLGGPSAERDVSFVTGQAVAAALAERGHRVTGLDPAREEWYDRPDWFREDRGISRIPPAGVELRPALQCLNRSLSLPRVRDFDVIFVGLHGGAGEDGTVQTLLEIAGVPYTGSGPLASALAMHKHTSKCLFQHAEIPTPRWLYPARDAERTVRHLGLPLIVKPVSEGSTVGVTLIHEASGMQAALELAGAGAMAEAFVPGRELSVGVLADRTLPAVELLFDREIFDYECKYTDGMTEYRCPAPMEEAASERLGELARRAFTALGCRGYARVDFRLDADGVAWCLEVNTLPGMTSHSLVPMGAQAVGIDFGRLCEQICEAAQAPRRAPAPVG